MTVPNVLTILRILLTPLLVWLLLEGKMNWALVVFIVAGITDGLDGFIARVFNQKSHLGAYLDPLADKILLMTTFVMLGRLGKVPDWLVIIAVSRDAIILMGLMTLMFHNVEIKIKPSGLSKATTFMQLVSLLSALGGRYVKIPGSGCLVIFVTTAILTVVSGFHYIKIGFSLLDNRRGQGNGRQH